MNELEQRINDLEIKYSYQDEVINELNLIIADQQNKIDIMRKALIGLIDDHGEAGITNSSLKDDRPPHY